MAFVIFAADAAHNLPFMHSYAVLSDVLLQLAREGRFECKNIFLGKLLSESETQLRWINFRLIKEGADRRNDVAHRGEVLPRGDCWRYIDAIKEQLVVWEDRSCQLTTTWSGRPRQARDIDARAAELNPSA